MPDFTLELAAGGRVAGVDEAGRGPLAGPVLAAAVVFPHGVPPALAALLDDSKRLSAAAREAAQVRRELEAVTATSNPVGGGGGGGALMIRHISARAADADRLQAELERFKAQVAEQVRAEAAGKGAVLEATAKAPSRASAARG